MREPAFLRRGHLYRTTGLVPEALESSSYGELNRPDQTWLEYKNQELS